MRFIDPGYTVKFCPDGQLVLSLLEEYARTCYKSEDQIHPGEKCTGIHDLIPLWKADDCGVCKGTGWKVEPSSYRLIRRILKTDQREQILKKVIKVLATTSPDRVAAALVDLVMEAIFANMTEKHESVIEHMIVTVHFDCNRGVSHELVRHRLASYSQESTRYCNYSKDKHGRGLNIIEPSHRPRGDSMSIEAQRRALWESGLATIERVYLGLLDLGEKPQFARDILPIGIKTEIVSTFNLRQWRYVFMMRGLNKGAHPQIRELMLPLLADMKQRIPLVFEDLVEF